MQIRRIYGAISIKGMSDGTVRPCFSSNFLIYAVIWLVLQKNGDNLKEICEPVGLKL
jgi:hypothetical protein